MPQRLLRPTIRQSKRWNQCSYFEQSLYIRLLTLVDDYARYEADPELIKSEAFPYGEPAGDCLQMTAVASGLLALASRDMLSLYDYEGVRYLQLTRWKERVRASESKYPDPKNGVLLSNAVICQQMSASPPSPSPQPTPLEGGPPTPQFAETPSWEEFWGYCQQIGCHGESFCRDKFGAADQENWSRARNWRGYATRVKSWWEEKGRPMNKPGDGAANGSSPSPASASPYVLEQMRRRKAEELEIMQSNAEASSVDRFDPIKKAKRKELKAQISAIDSQLEKAAGLVA